ncbi:MAG: hypothetical protein ACOY90_00635 [Candidatus Zhuqueibacterota bacterium]
MNTGQMLLTLGALALLSLTILNMNKVFNLNEELLNETRFGLETVALATSIIEEASQLPFDEVSWDSTKLRKDVSDFTLAEDLGADEDETDYDSFDDFDDFNNYQITQSTLQNNYSISCEVAYIDYSDLDTPLSNRTYYKKLTVRITNPFTAGTFEMSYIHGYWYFN